MIKECGYCGKNEGTPYPSSTGCMMVENGTLFIDLYSDIENEFFIECEINFCPMCGKKLLDEEV